MASIQLFRTRTRTRSFIVLIDIRKFGLCVAKNKIHTYADTETYKKVQH